MAKVLIVEDHENISKPLSEMIASEGHSVQVASSLKIAFDNMKSKPELIILDWMLPDGQGIDFLKSIRSKNINTPVIFLTARVDTMDKVLGLEMGAHDYLTKPFEPRELLARIRVQMRSTTPPVQSQLNLGSLSVDKISRKVSFKGQTIELVKKEFDLLVLLAESPDKVFSRDEILNKVWGYDVYPTTRTVDTHIMLLRQKISEQLIETVRAVGYRLKVL